MTDHIKIETQGQVRIIRFNRAEKKNALTRAMYATLAATLRQGDGDDAIGAHLILGEPGVFTAGNDLNDFLAVATGGAHGTEVVDFLRAVIDGKKPLVAGVDGVAVGVGATMLLHCDLVYASPRAELQTPFIDLGVVPENASSLVAPRIMGLQKASALLLLGEKFGQREALESGLATFATTEDDLEQRALEGATRLAEKPREAMAIARRLLRGDRAEIIARMEEEGRHFAERLKSDEARQAFVAFMSRGK